jgi:hypothetical protein
MEIQIARQLDFHLPTIYSFLSVLHWLRNQAIAGKAVTNATHAKGN